MGIRLIKKNEGAPSNKASSFSLSSKTSERDVEKFVATIEDAVLNGHIVETEAEPFGTIDVNIYGKLSPDAVSRILQVAYSIGIHVSDLTVNV